MIDIDMLYLYQRIEQAEWAMNAQLSGVRFMDVDDPFVQAKTDLTDWRARFRVGRVTYLEGWLLWQIALWELEVERHVTPAGAGKAAA